MESKDILMMQETERKRIAEELHDTTVQDMVHLSQQLEFVLYYMDNDIAQARLEAAVARKQIKNIIGGMRDTIYNLRPIVFDDIGWNAAFTHLHDKLLQDNPELHIVFDIDDIDISDGITALSIYRIVCEGCQNILKHAKAENIEVIIKKIDGFVKICIHDDGVGFESEMKDNHFGLQFMREKVEVLLGNFDIDSNSSGTFINISIPVNSQD